MSTSSWSPRANPKVPQTELSRASRLPSRPRSAGIETDFEEAAVFDLRVLGPVRTLVEKLMILHHAATAGDETEQVRHARHYYDVWCLLNDEPTIAAFTEWPCDAMNGVAIGCQAGGVDLS